MVGKDVEKGTVVIVSILIAFVMWMYVMGEKNPIQTKKFSDIPVTLINVENIDRSDLSLLPGQNFSVNIEVKGRAKDLANMSQESIKLEADMGVALRKGDNNIPIEVKQMPDNVKLSDNESGLIINVRLDNLLERSIPVALNISGSTKSGFGYLEAVLKPTEVLVSGPQSYVSLVNQIIAQVDLKDAYSDFKGTVPLKALDYEGKLISHVNIEPKYIDITVPIRPSKTVPIIVKTKGTLPSGFIIKNIKPGINSVAITGDENLIKSVTRIETKELDISGIRATTNYQLDLVIPNGVKVEGSISKVDVSVEIDNIIEKTLTVNLNVINEREGYSYNPLNKTIDVKIKGAGEFVNSINPGNISAYIDVSGLDIGKHTLDINVLVPSSVELIDFNPKRTEVDISK